MVLAKMKVHEHPRKRTYESGTCFKTPHEFLITDFPQVWYLQLIYWKMFRPFPSSPGPLYETEVKCSCLCYEIMPIKTHYHKKGCALGLVLKVKVFGSQKWLICCPGLGHLYLLFNAPPWGIFTFSKTKWQMPDKCPGGGNGHAWNWLGPKCSRVSCVSFRRKT